MTRLQPFFSTIELAMGYLHLAKIQKIIKEELRNKSGIYGFICKTNNKLYIGSSINLNMRFNNHIKNIKSNVLLQNAINKYNLQDFIFIVFSEEYCEPDKLLSREQFYLDELKPDFNILKTAGSSLGYKHTEESLAMMSLANSGDNHPMFGKKRSEETKLLMSLSKIGENNPMFGRIGENSPMFGRIGENHPMFSKSHSAETKAKMGEAKTGEQ